VPCPSVRGAILSGRRREVFVTDVTPNAGLLVDACGALGALPRGAPRTANWSRRASRAPSATTDLHRTGVQVDAVLAGKWTTPSSLTRQGSSLTCLR